MLQRRNYVILISYLELLSDSFQKLIEAES